MYVRFSKFFIAMDFAKNEFLNRFPVEKDPKLYIICVDGVPRLNTCTQVDKSEKSISRPVIGQSLPNPAFSLVEIDIFLKTPSREHFSLRRRSAVRSNKCP